MNGIHFIIIRPFNWLQLSKVRAEVTKMSESASARKSEHSYSHTYLELYSCKMVKLN